MEARPNKFELIGYLEEALPIEAMTRVEELLRQSQEWRHALAELLDDVEPGDHSVATIWRRHRLTCPSRERLGGYLMGGLVPEEADYIKFHLEVVRCRWCLANQADLESQAIPEPVEKRGETLERSRRRRFFETSVGHLPPT